MRLLVTGYPGWLTSRFLETLKEYPTPITRLRFLVHPSMMNKIKPNAAYECVSGDILKPDTLTKATQDMDVVLHTAGVLHVKWISEFYAINREGVRNLLSASVENRVKRFIFISTNAAQGFCEGRGHELSEDQPNHPKSHYGKSKLEGEEIVRKFQKQEKIQTVVIRPAMFYGPPVAPRHIDIFKRVKRGSFPVFGDALNLRSITYIDNLIQGIHLVMQNEKSNGQTYYIADEVIPTLKDLIEMMARCLDSEVKLMRFPKWMAVLADKLDLLLSAFNIYCMPLHIVGESHKNIACRIDKAKRELGYKPKFSYREGYPATMNWCQQQGLI